MTAYSVRVAADFIPSFFCNFFNLLFIDLTTVSPKPLHNHTFFFMNCQLIRLHWLERIPERCSGEFALTN